MNIADPNKTQDTFDSNYKNPEKDQIQIGNKDIRNEYKDINFYTPKDITVDEGALK